jgi:enamine deaminase RidA (YjgF/YER057c/UK114 family)
MVTREGSRPPSAEQRLKELGIKLPAALNLLAVARQHLGSLDKVTRIVQLGASVATSGDVRDQPKVADAASELLQDVFGKDKIPCRLVYGVASLPLGIPVELEVIFEVGA